MLKKYPFLKQSGIKDCGVSCLSMIISYYKGYVPICKLREMTKTSKHGCTAYHLIETAKEIGFESKGVKAKLNQLNKKNLILPCIAYTTIDENYNHYIVIYEINYNKKYLLIGDPGDKLKKMSFKEFEKIFNDVLIILYPKIKLPLYKKPISFNKFIFNIIKKHKKLFFQITLLSIFITITSIIGSFYFKYMIDNISNNSLLSVLFSFFLIVYIFKIITDFFRNKLLIIMNQKLDVSLNCDIFKTIILLPYNYFKSRTTGEVISRINDLNIIKEMIVKISITVFIDLSLTFFAAIFLYIINVQLFLIAIIILILYTIILLIFKPMFKQSIKKIHQKKSLINSYMVENISGFETIKGLSIEDNVVANFNKNYINFSNSQLKHENIYNLEFLFKQLIGEIGLIIIIYYGCLLYSDNIISLGELITFNSLFSYFLEPFRNIIDLNKDIKEAEDALKRINELIYIEEEKGILKNKKFKNIKIKDLDYTYNDIKLTLQNITLNINKGEKIMFIGQSGSGKSTILKLLKGYYKVDNNKIIIDHNDYNYYKKENINQNITYVSQNEMLFTESLYNNIKSSRNVNDKKILEVIKMCFVDEIIKNNNLGLNMLIEENGFNISGGEKQRIILARSLLNDFEILILDESLSQVDIDLERKIIKNIFKKYKNKTIILVSHRYDNLDLFDKVVRLDNGKIKEVNRKNG